MHKLYHTLILLLVSASLFCQPWERDDAVFNPSGIPSLTFSQPRFADLDDDGDFDMILGSTNDAPLYFENTGSATAAAFAPGDDLFAEVSSLDAEMGVCVDIDNDGDLDLITGGYTGLHLYRNIGSATQPEFSHEDGFFSGLNVGQNPVPDLADFDDDGDPDLVVGLSEDGSVLLYENTGNAQQAIFSQSDMELIADIGLYAYPVFADFDQDGDEDILCGRDSHNFSYFENAAGDWQQNDALFTGLGSDTYWNSPDLVDLDGDDVFDLIYGTASGPLAYHVNNGSGTSPSWSENTSLFGGVLDVGGASNPVFCDFDGDGDLDMISGSQLGDIKYFENTGNAQSPAWQEDSSYFASIDHSIYAAVAIGDIDNDGDADAIVGDLSGNLYFHRNDGMGFSEETGFFTGFSVSGWSAPRLLDMDDDGDLDIAVGGEDGEMSYLENQGTASAPDWVEIGGYFGTIDVGSNCVPSFADFDADGDYDFAAGNLFGDVTYFEYGMGWEEDSAIFDAMTMDQNATPALVDLDADGDYDLVVGCYDGTFSYWRNLMYSGEVLNPPRNLAVEIDADVVLTWDEPLEGSTSPFVGYCVYLDGEEVAETTALTWTPTGLEEGQSYTVMLTAVYQAGESLPATIGFIYALYNPPENLTYDLSNEAIDLHWDEPQGSTYDVAGYRVYVDYELVGSPTERTWAIENPQHEHTYMVAVTAMYPGDIESEAATREIYFTGCEDIVSVTRVIGNYPNPFNPTTVIRFDLAGKSKVSLDIFNAKGQKVTTLLDGMLSPDSYSIPWDASGQSSGIYLYRLKIDGKTYIRKMVMIK